MKYKKGCTLPFVLQLLILDTFSAVPCQARIFCLISMAATKTSQIYNNAVSSVALINTRVLHTMKA